MAHVSAAERRPQLIRAAVDLMAREGVAAGSTRAIAAELGVAQATVHYTFGTKEDLYRAVLRQLTHDLVRQVEESAPTATGFEETIAALADTLWRTVREQPERHQLFIELALFALRTPSLREALEGNQREVTAVTAKLLTGTAERTGHRLAQPASTIARFFLAGFDGLTVQHLSLPDEDAERACLRALVSSVVALSGGSPDLVRIPTA